MGIFLGIYDSPGGALLLDLSTRAARCQITQGRRGFQALGLAANLTQAEAYRAYEWPKPLHVVAALGSQILFEGRLEDPAIGEAGLEGTAIGYASAVGDGPYTALWSTTHTDAWRPVQAGEIGGATPNQFEMDTDNQIYIAPRENTTHSNAIFGIQTFETPNGGSRQIVGVEFDYSYNLPVGWKFDFNRYNRDFSGGVNLFSLNGTGVLVSDVYHAVVTATDRLALIVYKNGVAAVFAGAGGSAFVKITNMRVVTATTNRIATTLGTAIAAGVRTVTPGSMTGIYAGQRVRVTGAPGESVVVSSLTAATFTATFAQAHLAADQVLAHRTLADEIAKDIRAGVTTLNSGQLAASDALIQSPGVDLLDEDHQDADAPQILDRLASLGDNQTPPRRWRWFVNERRMLNFRPEDDLARTWYVDVTPDTERSLSKLFNSAYGVYEEAGGRTLRTAVASNAASVTRHGITRRAAVKTSTTSSTQAGIHRDAYIEDHKNPTTRASLPIPAVFDAYGQWHRKDEVRPGDVLVFRLLPPTLLTAITNISRMRIGQTTYDPITDSLTVEPDAPAASLEFLHLREEIGR